MLNVFISSTSSDLKPYRQAVRDVILRLDLFPITMEAFTPTENNALQLCYDKVQKADIFVGIYAYRYGYTPAAGTVYHTALGTQSATDGETSITHLEYIWAMERQLPMLLFVVAENDGDNNIISWPDEFKEDDPGKTRLDNFKKLILNKHVVGFFYSPDHLALQVAAGLSKIGSGSSIAINSGDQDQNRRQRLIRKMNDIWIEGYLVPLRNNTKILEVNVNHYYDAVLRTNSVWDSQNKQVVLGILSDLIKAVVTPAEKHTLILGQRGSGKTITLMLITEHLLRISSTDRHSPIPVILNLSTWVDTCDEIATWIAKEIYELFRVFSEVVMEWLKAGQLAILLDGLDEVNIRYREECVKAINRFLDLHDYEDAIIIISCRTDEYEQLKTKLHVHNSLQLRPLSDTQIQEYVYSNYDIKNDSSVKDLPEANHLIDVIKQDKRLFEIARSPLMLNIIVDVYKNHASMSIERSDTVEDWYQYLFDRYVELTFERHKYVNKSYIEKTKHWINWLARKMKDDSQTIFFVDHIQPDWLSGKTIRTVYDSMWNLSLFLLLGVPTTLAIGLLLGSFMVTTAWMVMGILFSITLCLVIEIGGNHRVRTIDAVLATISISLSILVMLGELINYSIAVVLAIICGSVVYFAATKFGNTITSTLGSIDELREDNEVLTAHQKPIYHIETLGWQWKNAIKGTLLFIVVALVLIISLLLLAEENQRQEIVNFLVFILSYGIPVSLAGGLTGVEVEDDTLEEKPNRAFRKSFLNYLKLTSLFGIIGAILSVLLISILGIQINLIILAITVFLGTGSIVGIQFGGRAAIKHIILRGFLTIVNVAPINYSKFLNQVCDLGLMKPVGRGYQFVHVELRNYLANLK